MLKLDYKSGKSIHEQIQDGIKELIMAGILKEDDKLPSVREVSISLTVNPNTVQKAYKELELNGVIYSVPGKGSFVSTPSKAEGELEKELLNNFSKTLRELKFLGIEKNRLTEILDEIYKGDKND